MSSTVHQAKGMWNITNCSRPLTFQLGSNPKQSIIVGWQGHLGLRLAHPPTHVRCASKLGLSILTCDPTHPLISSDPDRNSPDLPSVMVGGGFSFSETESDRSVGMSSHEKLSPTDQTRLLSPDANLARLGQVSMRSVEIQPNLDEIYRDPSRFRQYLLKSSQISMRSDKILTRSVEISTIEICWFQPKTNCCRPERKPTQPVVFSGWR